MSQLRHALVTGGGKGIGREIAKRLASLPNTHVTILGREVTALASVADAIGAEYRCVDMTNEYEIAEALSELPSVDILVNNVGAAMSKPFSLLTAADWQNMMEVNVYSTAMISRLVLDSMSLQSWGRIINIASTAGLKGYRYSAAYCAAKHAVVGMTRALAIETATSGVTVNAICPGFTDTELFQRAIETIIKTSGRAIEEATKALVANNPQKRLIDPSEVAELVLYLCSDAAASITGTSMPISGGEVM